MQLNQLKSDRAWRAALGMSEAKFRQLAVLFEQTYQIEYEVYIAKQQQYLKREFAFSKMEDLLFYVLFCQKNPPIHDIAVQRPENKGRQKEMYSGKKMVHLQIFADKGGRRSYLVRQQTICRDR
jgi:hypothetical protein